MKKEELFKVFDKYDTYIFIETGGTIHCIEWANLNGLADELVKLTNKRVIEELESIKNQCRFYSDRLIGGQAYGFNEINSIVTKRIKELKQD